MSRLVVVSNRVALPNRAAPGGLASALRAAMARSGGLWFGWSGRHVATEASRTQDRQRHDGIEYAVLDLTRAEYEAYYLGFANRSLWPLLHFQPAMIDFQRGDQAGYRAVNALFARHLAPLLRADDSIWVHDYHLIPLAAELRRLGVAARIGFFLHVPVPPTELLHVLPQHAELFRTLTEYDLIGTQTEADCAALRDYMVRELDVRARRGGVLQSGARRFRIGAFPISIDTAQVARQAQAAGSNATTRRLLASLQGRELALGVDRLDYSKGLPTRFEAFGRFLQQHPHWRSRVSFLQIAPPSREDVPEYRALRARLERIAGATNGRYAEPDWVPIRYVNRSFQHVTLTGFYRLAQLALVTPLRDGMNLVAKEYIAAQPQDDPGVLILSRFAGAAQELDQAILVNPFDVDDIADGIEQALTMPPKERLERWQGMFAYLCKNDIGMWSRRFLQALGHA